VSATEAEDVLLARQDAGVLWLTLNRPARKNSISPELRQALLERLDAAGGDPEVRCLVLTGAGDAFCAGVDITRFRAAEPNGITSTPDPWMPRRTMKQGMQRVIRALLELEKPVIAAVNGVAAGGGAQLALACDLVVAADTARFIEVFVRRGMALDSGGGYLLPRLVGLARAKEIVFFGDDLAASDAERIGLVNRVVPGGELRSFVDGWAARLAKGPTRAIGASKVLLNRSLQSDLATSFEDEASLQSLVALTDDYREGIRAFMEKRDPEFRGR
jgi:2-(1,2-epoxy-1,2-dihydrophenyl)acetyl-CoA isomerase